jgi:hypothetical protein
MKRGYPDRRKLECQCICSIAFVKNEAEVLDSPCWIMLINIVAMDMLKSKIPPGKLLFSISVFLIVSLSVCLLINSIPFAKNEAEVLDSPCWIMLINIVAMDMLKSKIPPG